MNDYLPISKKDMRKRGWDEVDFVYVCGDAYVDHPSFGMAIITRVLEAHGFRIGVICQPDWKDEQSVQVFGRPRLGFLVSAGNMSITILFPRKDAIKTPILREALLENVRIMQP